MARKISIHRKRELEQRAWAMAQSGHYMSSRAIKAKLIDINPNSEEFFANLWVRQELDRICQMRFRQPVAA
jgi:hypothetical protein